MATIKIKPALLNCLFDLQTDLFTVADLTHAYLKSPESLHKGQTKPARQFVYRNMLRMIKSGLLEKMPGKDGWPRYKFTSLFQVTKSTTNSLHSSPPHGAAHLVKATPKSENQEKFLVERLSKHKSEMLCALGEAEEYENLCKEAPELRYEAQSLYNEARERSTLLLGKIKALESLLSHYDR